ncbi:NAD(P)-dependent alcohol dehydrogenase [Nonomuraea angiospora]|uniref:NAD(P)-dependent alcohol dehydrogenase n=1 Tax=Nonomuraea angiospora TaxID=46172 RepID=UPI003447BF90
MTSAQASTQTSTVTAYAAAAAGQPLTRTTIERRALAAHDINVEIHYTGICHSDIHQVHGDWGKGLFPMVPGHEITGIVAETGSEVTTHQVGDRVGVGVIINSCGRCDNCAAGRQQYCTGGGSVETYGDLDRYRNDEPTQGGYSTHIVVDEHFAYRIPKELSLQQAAPLLCAGITTYSPLKHWNAGPGTKVAVIGLGGLGHVAVKVAHALGADVTVLSQSLRKKDDGLRLGADHYYATSDPKTFEELAGTFDLIICTVSAPLDVDAHLSLLTTEGTLVYLGVPDQPISTGVFSLLTGRRSLAGSLIGGVPETQEMLDFCAEHGIGADVEVVRADQINEAFQRVLNSDVRYRFVIDNSTI